MNTGVKNNVNSRLLIYPALIISSLFLLIPAFYNHYPLVNPDTATYLASGFKPETPFDRPITYGLLIRCFSLNGLSLWLVVFMQAFIVSSLIFKITQHVAGDKFYLVRGMCIILFLSLCSSLSWIVSQVQPDVFTSIAFLCIILLLMNRDSRTTELLLCSLFFLSVAVHLSHPLLFTITLLCLFVFKRYFVAKEAYIRVNKKIATLIILSVASMVVMGSAFSKSKHVFFIGSLMEKGVLKKYLDENCAAGNYKICAYKDSLPANVNDFWWDNSSPLYKIGGWKDTKIEFNDIIHNILTSPKYLKLYMTATATQAWKQMATFNIGDGNTAFPPGANVNQRVAEYFPREIDRFNKSEQNSADHFWLQLALPNIIFVFVFWISIAAMLFVFAGWKRMATEMKLVLIICFAGIIFNCLDCAAFGIVNGRYGCKMIWLLPFCIILYFTGTRKKSL